MIFVQGKTQLRGGSWSSIRVTREDAEDACAPVLRKVGFQNCVNDVMSTNDIGIAGMYEIEDMEQAGVSSNVMKKRKKIINSRVYRLEAEAACLHLDEEMQSMCVAVIERHMMSPEQ